MVREFALLAVSAIALISCASAPVQTEPSEPSMLCRVVADPAAFDGQEVTVRGIFASDYQHYSSLIDPSCPHGLPPYASGHELGRAAFDAALCSENGGLVEVTARGRIEARSGEIPSVKFHVEEYSDPRALPFDPRWADRYGVLRSESTERWDGRRRLMCMVAGIVDPNTGERRVPAQ